MHDVRAANNASHQHVFGSTDYTSCVAHRRDRVIVKQKLYKPARGQGGARLGR